MLTSIKIWLKKHDSFSHIVEGAIVYFPLWALLAYFAIPNAHWIGAALIIGAFYGRERRDYEIHLNTPLYISSFDLKTYLPWTWTADGKRDFFYPFFFFMAVATITETAPKIVPLLETFFSRFFS